MQKTVRMVEEKKGDKDVELTTALLGPTSPSKKVNIISLTHTVSLSLSLTFSLVLKLSLSFS